MILNWIHEGLPQRFGYMLGLWSRCFKRNLGGQWIRVVCIWLQRLEVLERRFLTVALLFANR